MGGEVFFEAVGLRGGYGRNTVLRDASIGVDQGKICGLIGPNGAGKSTLFKGIYGLLPLRGGHIRYNGQDISNLPARERLMAGIGYVPQERNIFPNLTVIENLDLAASRLPKQNKAAVFRERVDHIFGLFPKLGERRSQVAGLMSGGEQRMVALGIGLMTKPRILLLDEPTTGLAPILVHLLMNTIRSFSRHEGISILIVEQNIASLLNIVDALAVMKDGSISPHRIAPDELGSRKIWEYL
jgi:branched-chain amino acid transport system ATP-binding protein